MSGDDGVATDAAPSSSHVAIGFDELPNGTTIVSQYADKVAFSSEPGIPIIAEDAIDLGQSPHNYVSAGGGSDVDHPMYLAFARPVHGLTFHALGVSDSGTVAHIKVYAGTTLAGTENLVGQADNYTPVPVSLAAYSHVTRIEVVDITDLYGFVYDDFAFDQED